MRKPVLVVVAGPNGSGKTSLTKQLLAHQWLQGCEYINPDQIAQDTYGDWNSPKAIMSAAKDAEAIRQTCLQQGRSIAFETVFSAPDKLDFIKQAKDRGFFVRLFFVATSHPTINAARVARRVMEGGHDVPIPKIIARYAKSLVNGALAAQLADRSYFFDNSADGQPARLLFKLARQTDETLWIKRYSQVDDAQRNSPPSGTPHSMPHSMPKWAQMILDEVNQSPRHVPNHNLIHNESITHWESPRP